MTYFDLLLNTLNNCPIILKFVLIAYPTIKVFDSLSSLLKIVGKDTTISNDGTLSTIALNEIIISKHFENKGFPSIGRKKREMLILLHQYLQETGRSTTLKQVFITHNNIYFDKNALKYRISTSKLIGFYAYITIAALFYVLGSLFLTVFHSQPGFDYQLLIYLVIFYGLSLLFSKLAAPVNLSLKINKILKGKKIAFSKMRRKLQ